MSYRKRINKNRFIATINKESFYIVLFLCLILLAATAVWVTKNNLEFYSRNDLPHMEDELPGEHPLTEVEPGEDSPAVLIEDGQKESDADTGKEQQDSEVSEPQQSIANEKQTAEQETSDREKSAVTASASVQKADSTEERMLAPLLGKICMDYGKDSLVYSKTLEQWTTHHGIDIAASVGTPVKAVRSGTVTEIKTHPGLGIMITIDHGNGLVTRYANLQNGNMVKEGQKVEQGKVISGVGNTAEFEIGDVPHLHFEVLKDGEHRDPKIYLPNM